MSNEELAGKLLDRNRVGALLRVLTPFPEMLDYQVTSALDAAAKLNDLKIDGKKVFARIDLLVSNDQRYGGSDTMSTADHLRAAIIERFTEKTPIHILNIQQGDLFCMLLNYGIVNQLEDRIPYSFIIRHAAQTYITEKNTAALLAAMHNKARVAGLAVRELHDSVMHGRIVNTFSVWHNKSLMTVGGFDVRAAMPLRGSEHPIITTSDEHGNMHSHPLAGSEEIIPLIRMVRNFGPCIAPIEPEKLADWKPDANEHPKERERLERLVASKKLRQEHFAKLEGTSLHFLTEGILDTTRPD